MSNGKNGETIQATFPAPKLLAAQAKIQISVCSPCSFHNTRKRQKLLSVGCWYRWWLLALLMVKLWLDVVIWRSPHGRIFVWFGLVLTTEAHIALSSARTHSNSANNTVMIEALAVLGLYGPVARKGQSCIDDESLHAARICLSTIQARTHVQVVLACQQSMIRAQHRLRLTMQQVFRHGCNLGNECAYFSIAIGTFGFISSHNDATLKIQLNFDVSVFDACHNFNEVWHHWCHCVSCASHVLFWSHCVFLLSVLFLSHCFFVQWWTAFLHLLPCQVLTHFVHNVWNLVLECFCSSRLAI